MSNLFVTLTRKQVLYTLLLILALGAALSVTAQTAAHPSRQSIPSEEVRLDGPDLAENGTFDGLVAGPAGLALAEGQVSGIYLSEVVGSPLPFTTDVVPLWEAELPAGTELTLELRRMLGEDRWDSWQEVPVAFYPVRENLHGGNLVWMGADTTAVQVRVSLQAGPSGASPTLKRIIFAFSDTSGGPTDAEIASQRADLEIASTSCPPAKPDVVSRSEWGVPAHPTRPPVYHPVSHVVVHHSVTPNETDPYQDWAGWVRSIWNYHANILGWGDVGYNYLIDPHGVIYEGRDGGENVVGIHDGFNAGSMGLGFIGCYGNCENPYLTNAEPSQEMLDGAANLIAWKFEQETIDPFSSGQYAGRLLPVIAGGRDVTQTASPGDNLYARLPDLRSAVETNLNCAPTPTDTPTATATITPTSSPTQTVTPDLEACQITDIIFDRDQYNVGDVIEVTARLADHLGVPLSGAKVVGTVEKEVTIAQAPTGFGLVDRTGEYDGTYANTDRAGTYRFIISASDPTGERFAPCTAEELVAVIDSSATPTATTTATVTATSTTPATPDTPTVTPTATTTPIATPTGTVTPEPDENVLTFEPLDMVISLSSAEATNAVVLRNGTGLTALAIEIAFDPAIVEAVAIRPNSLFTNSSTGIIARNEIDNEAGRIYFDAALLNPNEINGEATLLEIDWAPVAEGTSALQLENVILVGGATELTPHIENGSLQVTSGVIVIVTGQTILQGRSDHSGVQVTTDYGAQATTDSAGLFSVPAGERVYLKRPGYLSAEASAQTAPALSNAGTGPDAAQLGTITLLAGDVNGDDAIDILDLALMASRYKTTDSAADLNGDGQVNIVDLALAAGNYRQQGPLTAWQ